MRKKSIVEEFKQLPIPGTVVMKEKTNFITGKMMDIEDEFRITYNYNSDINIDLLNPTVNAVVTGRANMSYDSVKAESLLSIEQDKAQSAIDSNTTTRWVFEFDSKHLLREYLYNEIYTLNPQSPFKQIPNGLIPGDKIGQACYDYIDKNLMDRYRLKEFILWAQYYDLKNNIVPRTGTDLVLNPEIKLLSKSPVFSYNAVPVKNPDLNKETISLKQYDDGTYEVYYKQTKSSQYFTFIYYYDVIYEKI